jgi:hypothetical protein
MVLLGDEAQLKLSSFGDSANLDARLVHTLRRTYRRFRNWFGLDAGLVESCFFLFGDSVSVGARWVYGLHWTYHRLRNHFGRT